MSDVAANRNGKLPLGYSMDLKRMVHVSEVTRGLSCNCKCPGCGDRLVARKGNQMRHHFSHTGDSRCGNSFETALHLFAKELLAERKSLTLPASSVSHKGTTRSWSSRSSINFESIVVESREKDLQPDIIGMVGGKRLAIEIAVTHFCDAEKVEKYRKAEFSAIEIDLSEYREVQSLNELSDLILNSATRYWLFNPQQERLRNQLAQEAERKRQSDLRKEKERRKRKAEAHHRHVTELIGLCEKARLGQLQATRSVKKTRILAASHNTTIAGITNLVGIDLPGQICFQVDAKDWQSAILWYFIVRSLRDRGWGKFETKAVLQWVKECELLWPGFAGYISQFAETDVQVEVPDFCAPYTSIREYLLHLQRSRILQYKKWRRSWEIREDIPRV